MPVFPVMKQDSCDAITLPNPRPMTLASTHSEIPHHCPGSYNVPTPLRKFANPGPLGLSSFATTTFLLSLFNVQTRGIHTENLIVSMAFAYGGIVQVLAGMWEFACGNTFGATAFSSYGGFWISFGLILSPSSGILAAYATKKDELESALGLYLFSWFIFTTMMLLGSLRTSVALIALFFFLDVTFLLLAIGKLCADTQALTKAGGVFGIITAFIAWYIAAAGLLEAENSFIRLPTIPLGDVNERDERKD
ncbi:uncharacterized protein PGTG_01615 [Puccinia graminis f. sp. tritici CRL 75-36-700-3]|uniref:Uncharacterized protein n=5 Tax=Puccinia graminis f. sp. tritici TaxID=56615 RepID=E3JSA1_PUCGT|nr:uncharacterized protein PGTG_01615 [Puccinia graminis f. sp. tritici CRL 75-36-700-3]EFP75022.1 hypothetical protein PGTG_01615 [Puccinia graminis f. sp. tritici CRL 75-36-700-3]